MITSFITGILQLIMSLNVKKRVESYAESIRSVSGRPGSKDVGNEWYYLGECDYETDLPCFRSSR